MALMRLIFFRNKIAQKATIVVLLLGLVLSGVFFGESFHQKKIAAATIQCDSVFSAIDKITAAALAIETSYSAFLATGFEQFKATSLIAEKNLEEQKKAIKTINIIDVVEQKKIDSLLLYATNRIGFFDSIIAIKNTHNQQQVYQPEKQPLIGYANNVYRLSSEIYQLQSYLLNKEKAYQYTAIKIEHRIAMLFSFLLVAFWSLMLLRNNLTRPKKHDLLQSDSSVLSQQIDQSNDAIYTLDVDYKILTWSKGAEHLYGFSQEEAKGKNSNVLLQTNISKHDIQTAVAEIQQRKSWSGELERKTKEGRTITVESSVTVIKNEAGNVKGYIVVNVDITTQKNLQEQISYLASMVEQSTEAIFSRDVNRRMISWNKGAEKLFGYTSSEVIGKLFGDLKIANFSREQIITVEDQISTTGNWKEEIWYTRKDGTHFFGLVTGNCIRNIHGKITAYYFIVKDISNRKQAEENLHAFNEELEEKVRERTALIAANERRFRSIMENNFDIISLMDASFKVIYRSPATTRILGWTDEDMKLQSGTKNIHPDDLDGALATIQFIRDHPGEPANTKFRMRHKDGHYLWVEGIIINRLQDADTSAIVFNYRDVTKRVMAEEKLIASEKQFRYSMDHMLEGVQILDFDWKYIYVNETVVKQSKYSREEMIGYTMMERFPGVEKTHLYEVMKECFAKRVSSHFENEFVFPDGSQGWFELSLQPVPEGIFILSVDITNKKRAELLLTEERDKFSIIAATSPGLIYSFQLNTDGSIIFPFVSSAAKDIFGFSQEEVMKDVNRVMQLWHPDDITPGYSDILDSAKNKTPWFKEFRYNHPLKGEVWLEGNSLPVGQEDGTVIWHGIITDITQRKIADHKLQKASRLYLFISQINQMIVRTTNENEMFKEACKIGVECGKFRMVWIGMVDELTNEIIPVEYMGEEQGYISVIKGISVDDIPLGRGPAGRAGREGRVVVCNDIESDPQMAPWRDAATSRGYYSSIGIPIKRLNKVAGVFNFYSAEKNFFDAEEIELLIEAVGDVSFALDNFEKEAARKKAEAAVAESEKRYHILAETSPVGIFHTDAEGSTTYVNPCWCSISGLSFDQALGNGWLSAVHPDDRELLTTGWNNEVLAHQTSMSEYRFVRPDGTTAWVIGQAIPEKNATGKIVGYVGTITDVTEHRKAEEIILKEKNLTDTLINNLPGIFYLYDAGGKFIRWNKNFEDITGFSCDEIKNMHPLDFYDDSQHQKISARIKTVFEKSEPGVEVEILKKDKTTVPFFINSLKINYGGKDCLLGMGLDLTERRKAEKEIQKASERYELIGKATNDGVWDWDLATGKVWANEMHQHLYGLTIEDSVPDYAEWLKRIHPDDRQRTEEQLDRARVSDSKSIVDEYRFWSDEKGWINIFGRIFIERNAAGIPVRLIGSMVDITEQKIAEEKLNEKNVQLQSLSDNLPGVMLFQLTGGADGNRKFNYVSNGSLHIAGKTPLEIINDPAILYNAILPEDMPLMIAAEADSYNNLKVFNVEVRSRNQNGEIRWLNIISSPRKLHNGSIIWDGFYVDITDRKLAEEATRISKESLEHAEELAQLGSWEIDTQNKSGKWSKQMFRLFEFDEAARVPSFTDYLQKIHIDDRSVVEENLQKMIEGVLPDTVGIFRTNNETGPMRFLQPSYRVFKNSEGKIIKFTGTIQDITERIVYENQLMVSEEKYRVLVEQASDGIFIADESGRFIMVNSSATKLSGYSTAELEKLSIYNLVHPDSLLTDPFKFEDMLLPQGAHSERKMLKKDGSTLDVEINAKFLPDKRFIAFIRDISERKKIAEEIKASEEKYRVLVEEASEGIYISDKTGRFVTVNASACRLAQHTEEELLDMSIYDFFVDDDLKARPPQFEALKQGKTIVSERIMKRKDGKFNHLEITSKLLTDGRLLSLVRDVADRKKAEEAIRLSNERYNLVAKATNDSIWDLDIVTGEISRTGEGFKTLFGYDEAAAVHSDPEFSTLVHPDDLSATRASMAAAFAKSDVFYWADEYRLLKANGDYAYVYDKGYIIRDENGKAMRMIGATQDITNRKENEIHLKKLNEDLLQQTKALADSNAELEQFAYVASHDLQEPLRMVTSFLSLLEINYATRFDEKGKSYIHFAVDGAKRMRQIILDLLEISRVGRAEDNMELLDLNLVVKDILHLLGKQIDESNAFIQMDDLPVLYAYRSSFVQVFQNLIGNSLKYKRKDVQPRISITVKETTDDCWLFAVADNGIGIDQEYFAKIFIIFQRLHNQNEFSGTGIGLAITKKIIENMGGKIWLESRPGNGTTFYFTVKK